MALLPSPLAPGSDAEWLGRRVGAEITRDSKDVSLGCKDQRKGASGLAGQEETQALLSWEHLVQLTCALDHLSYILRRILVFFIPMFLAGYAQSVNPSMFWSAWAVLTVLYWEPYMSPVYPWIKCAQEGAACGLEAGVEPGGLTERLTERLTAVQLKWLLALKGMASTPMYVYRFMQYVLLLLPAVPLMAGVVMQHRAYLVYDERRRAEMANALYSCWLLGALVAAHLAVITATISCCRRVWRGMGAPADGDAWCAQPGRVRDMMFFLCCILGEGMNSITSVIVSGAFVQFMSWEAFWLCTVLMGASFVANSVLYDLGPDGGPVCDQEGGPHPLRSWCKPLARARAVCRTAPPAGDEPARCTAPVAPRVPHQARPQAKKPFFLVYKWPKGVRGFAIIFLIIMQAPLAAYVLFLVEKDMAINGQVVDTVCGDNRDLCTTRSTNLLRGLVAWSFTSSYYAWSIGFVGAGFVTWSWGPAAGREQAAKARGASRGDQGRACGCVAAMEAAVGWLNGGLKWLLVGERGGQPAQPQVPACTFTHS